MRMNRETIKNEKEGIPVAAGELWFRENEKELIKRKEISTSVRAGDRTFGTLDPKGGYKDSYFIDLRIQRGIGELEEGKVEVVVTKSYKKQLKDITAEDMEGTPLGNENLGQLPEKLSRLYGKEFNPEDLITIVRFEYKENLKEAADLVRAGVIIPAEEAPNNPKKLEFSKYTLPLIDHDYPARTPAMWNAAYRQFGYDVGNVILVGDPKNAKHILDIFRRDKKYEGGGAGVGFKDEAIKHVDEVDEKARVIGAINFVLKTSEGKLKGYNTDGDGYAESLKELLRNKHENLTGKKIVIFGAGGAGGAIALALAERGARVIMLNRTVTKAEDLAKRINDYLKLGGEAAVRFGGEDAIAGEVRDADVILNTSTKGAAGALENYSALAPAKLPATQKNIEDNRRQAQEVLGSIPQKTILSDVILRKGPTLFLEDALRAGFETLDGLPMVINQGVEAFWILYGNELTKRGIIKEQVSKIMREAVYQS